LHALCLEDVDLAPRSRYDEIVEAVSNFIQVLPVGGPSDPAAQIGSLISEKQRARVEGYIARRRALHAAEERADADGLHRRVIP
jgi:acyl-CoA reductase-like NAD-dependent aldehyde dehydrogenase